MIGFGILRVRVQPTGGSSGSGFFGYQGISKIGFISGSGLPKIQLSGSGLEVRVYGFVLFSPISNFKALFDFLKSAKFDFT